MAPRFSHGGPRPPRGPDRRPRRRETPYRLTPARRAVGIRNLQRANLARKLARYPHPVAPEHLGKALANLKLADAARPWKWDCSRHGLYSALLPEAMRPAEEREFEAHVGRFVRALGAGPDAAEDELFLVRAAAELVWRHLRAFRCQGEWERAGVRKLLARFDGCPISETRRENLAFQLVEFLERGYERLSIPLGRLRRRLERVFCVLYLRRFGSDPGFRIFGSRWSLLVEAGASPEVMSSPALSEKQVWRVRENHEEGLGREWGVSETPRGAGGAPGARREERAEWRPFFRRIFAVSERPGDGRVKRAASLFEEAVARRLQIFPLEARRQAREVREIVEGAGVAAPLSERAAHDVLLGVLRILEASDGVFDDLSWHEDRLQTALVEWLETPYGRRPE